MFTNKPNEYTTRLPNVFVLKYIKVKPLLKIMIQSVDLERALFTRTSRTSEFQLSV